MPVLLSADIWNVVVEHELCSYRIGICVNERPTHLLPLGFMC